MLDNPWLRVGGVAFRLVSGRAGVDIRLREPIMAQ